MNSGDLKMYRKVKISKSIFLQLQEFIYIIYVQKAKLVRFHFCNVPQKRSFIMLLKLKNEFILKIPKFANMYMLNAKYFI